MKWGTTKGVEYREGDKVLIGRAKFGRPQQRGMVAANWDGESLVSVIPEGKTKPRPIASSMLRHARDEDGSAGTAAPPAPARRSTTKPPKLKAFPKPPPPARSAKYLSFVRAHPCACCARAAPMVEIEAHHWAPKRGVGQKVSDFRTVPLCDRCHRHFHDHGVLPELDVRTTHEVFMRAQVALMDKWLSRVLARAKARRPDAR